MQSLREKLTDARVRRYEYAARGQRQVSDTEQAGFYLLIGKKTKTYMVRVSVDGRVVKKKIGLAEDMTATAARRKAKELADEIRQSPDPGGPTFGQAWRTYRDARGAKWSPRTLESYEDAMLALERFHDRPFVELALTVKARTEVEQAHAEITEERGPYAANRAFELMRAVYNYNRPRHDGWPPDPPTVLIEPNDEEPADEGLDDEALAKWWASVQKAQNPVRQALHQFVLLSGHRPTAIKEARWEHLDVAGRSLHIPNPKGGRTRAFDMPLSRPMLRVLNQAKKAGEMLHEEHAREWIFPSAVGHVV